MRSLIRALQGGGRQIEVPWPSLADLIEVRPGNLIVAMAAPNVGKSLLGLNWALAIDEPSVIYSLDTDPRTQAIRAASNLLGVPIERIREEGSREVGTRGLDRSEERMARLPGDPRGRNQGRGSQEYQDRDSSEPTGREASPSPEGNRGGTGLSRTDNRGSRRGRDRDRGNQGLLSDPVAASVTALERRLSPRWYWEAQIEDLGEQIAAERDYFGQPPALVVVDNMEDIVTDESAQGYNTGFRALKAVARRSDTVVMALHHIHRAADPRRDITSGDIPIWLRDANFAGERQAAIVLGLWRPTRDSMRIAVLKNRFGPAHSRAHIFCELGVDLPTARIYE